MHSKLHANLFYFRFRRYKCYNPKKQSLIILCI